MNKEQILKAFAKTSVAVVGREKTKECSTCHKKITKKEHELCDGVCYTCLEKMP